MQSCGDASVQIMVLFFKNPRVNDLRFIGRVVWVHVHKLNLHKSFWVTKKKFNRVIPQGEKAFSDSSIL